MPSSNYPTLAGAYAEAVGMLFAGSQAGAAERSAGAPASYAALAQQAEALAPTAQNRGRLDLDALADGRPQPVGPGDGGYVLYRIGDALMSRDVHATLYEARRLCIHL